MVQKDLDIETLIAGLTNPDDNLKRLTWKASKLKRGKPAEWRRIAATVFGLSTVKGAELLMPQAVVIQARHINWVVRGRHALNVERTLWL